MKTKLILKFPMFLLLLLGTFFAPMPAWASGPVGDVIFNGPYAPLFPPTSVSDVIWDKYDHSLYDNAYTEPISIDKNGYATPDHIVMKNNSIAFYGYGANPYLNYVFTDFYRLNSCSFIMTPRNMNFHSFSEAGFLFNGQMTQNGGKIYYYTGYALVLQCANTAGVQENDPNAPNIASLRLYYINNEEWNTEVFRPGNTTNTRTLISTLKTNINNFDSQPYRVSVGINSTTRAFDLYIDGSLRASVPAAQVAGGAGGPVSFGFYNGSYAHGCTILTDIYFDDVTINANPLTAIPASAEVRFVEQGTNTPIRNPETENGYVTQPYKIVPPVSIKYNGITYLLTSSSRGLSGNMELIYKRPEVDLNTTTFYYIAFSSKELAAIPPEKTARVDGGEWEKGSQAEPVSAPSGSEIEYNITAYAPPKGIAMIRQGNDRSTGWWGNPTTISKSAIETAAFIDLSEIPDWSDQLTVAGTWNGKSIVSYWIATEQSIIVNPDRDNCKVYAWITEGSAPGKYKLYAGAVGGVWLSASLSSNYLFFNFDGLQSIDLSGLHTDLANNMVYMFALCSNLTTLNVSNFNTSNVTNMYAMFINCGKLTSLNLSSFNTSNVTNMGGMFLSCWALTTLNVSSFNTSNVVDMGQMFQDCNNLTLLNVRNFNTSKVTNMYNMFRGCNVLVSLDVSSFNTSNVTNMCQVFDLCSSLTTLNVSNFNTSNATNMSGMFLGCSGLTTLNLNNFNTAKVTDMSLMFSSASKLTGLHMENADFSRVTTYNNMFDSTPSTLKVYVKDSSAQTWMNGKITSPQQAVINPGGATNPVDWQLGYNPAINPDPVKYVKIRDAIPAGLNINTGSITGTQGAPAPTTIRWNIDGQTITWTVPQDSLPVTVSVKTTVGSGLPASTVFENTATITGQGRVQTDTTYHAYLDAHRITEQYFLYAGGTTTTNKIADDWITYVPTATPTYTVHSPDEAVAYVLVGYDAGSGFVAASDPSEIAGAVNPLRSDITVKLYYKQIFITVHYVNESGTEVKTVTEPMMPRSDYYLPQGSFDGFTVGSTVYNYYDYAKNIDVSVKNAAPAGAGNIPAVGSQPVYPNGAAPTFVYGPYPINADMDVTLYVTTKQAVTVYFVEWNNPLNVLHNTETWYLNSPFDPSTLQRSEGLALNADIDLRAEMEKLYRYAERYSINDGAEQTGFPASQTTPCKITLYFRTAYVLTEKFHTDNDAHDAVEIMPDVTSDYFGGDSFTGAPPATFNDGTSTWTYIGYKVGSDDNPLNPGLPSIASMTEDVNIIYVYEQSPCASCGITIIERWREYGNTGNILAPDETATVTMNGAYTDKVKNITGKMYVGWMLDNETVM